MEGHLVPELFVIGAPKASTTTFARSFRDSAGVYLARLPFKKKAGGLSKEVYFFDELAEDRALSLQKKGAWLEFYPRCLEERAVSTDMTPSYLRNTWSAGKIAEYYGDLKSKPVFVVLLREPVGRAQSHFNQMEELGTGLLPKGLTFSGFVTRYLQNGYDTEKKLMWCGQYAKQLRVWFQRFHSSQFWICPMKYHVDPHRFGIVPDLTSTLWDYLGLPRGQPLPGLHLNSHKHRSLEMDLDKDLLARVRSNLSSVLPDLAALLAASRARLFGYTGAAGDELAVRRWIAGGW